MNITKDLKKLVSKEEDINLKNKKTDILDSLDLTYSLQKEEYKYTPLLKNLEKTNGFLGGAIVLEPIL